MHTRHINVLFSASQRGSPETRQLRQSAGQLRLRTHSRLRAVLYISSGRPVSRRSLRRRDEAETRAVRDARRSAGGFQPREYSTQLVSTVLAYTQYSTRLLTRLCSVQYSPILSTAQLAWSVQHNFLRTVWSTRSMRATNAT